jgi:hypothetical protein
MCFSTFSCAKIISSQSQACCLEFSGENPLVGSDGNRLSCLHENVKGSDRPTNKSSARIHRNRSEPVNNATQPTPIIMVEHGHKTNTTSIEVCAYKCYDENKVVHYSNCCEPPVATFIVKDFPCKDGRVAKWILGRSLATLPTRRLICSQLFYATDGITSSTDGEVSTLTWFAKTSDQLTAGSDEYKMHSKPARMFTGKSVLVVTNDQAQSFLRLLGRPDKAAELQGAITGVHNEAVNEKSCEAAILAGGEGVGQHVYKRPSVMRKSILRKSNSKSAPAAKTDLKEADTIEGVKAIAYQRPSAMRKSILRKSNSNSTPAVKTDAKEADTIEGVKAIAYKRPSAMRKSILRNSNSKRTPAAKTDTKEADTIEGVQAIV